MQPGVQHVVAISIKAQPSGRIQWRIHLFSTEADTLKIILGQREEAEFSDASMMLTVSSQVTR